MLCKICEQQTREIFSAKILSRHLVKYYFCDNCEFLHTEDPYWLNAAYANPINLTDTGLLQRNVCLSRQITPILYYLFDKDGSYLDWAGGYGVFTRLMRDIGFDFYWADPYAENIFAKGFEYSKDLSIKAITSFESFEHFVAPMTDIQEMFSISKNIIFTTILLPKIIPKPDEWWYYGLEHGQHISFYSEKTLKYLASKFKLHLISKGNLHILSENKLNSFFSYLTFGKRGGKFRKILLKFISHKCGSSLHGKTHDDMNLLISKTNMHHESPV